MSDTDSFIDEVSEELRRDRLYALFRKWGWIPILLVVVIVGGAAYFEYQRAQREAVSQAFGDQILEALDATEPSERIDALDEVSVDSPEAQVILALLAAGEAVVAEDQADAAARLRAAAEIPELDTLYAHLALLKAQMLDPAPEAEARLVLEGLAAPGAPFAALAEEQLALVEVRAGDIEAAVDRLRALERSAAATAGLQQRAGQLIVALESGAILLDESPEPEIPEIEVDVASPVDLGGGAADDDAELAPEDAADEAPAVEGEAEAEVDAESDGDAGDEAAPEDTDDGEDDAPTDE